MSTKIMSKTVLSATIATVIMGASFIAQAANTDTSLLGTTLTPFGAEMAGNAAGTIPAWTGGLEAPADYVPGGMRIDPFADDKVEFSITAANYMQYADQLSAGQKALFAKFPETYRMDIYPTHRPHSLPDWINEHTALNATEAQLVEGGNGIVGAYGGVPFPMPETGVEVAWNHLTKFLGQSVEADSSTYIVYSNGTRSKATTKFQQQFGYYDPEGDRATFSGNLYEMLTEHTEPVRRKGEILLVVDALNAAETPRQAWQYIPGQRRVRRAPTIAYDTPDNSSSGLATFDDAFNFNGATDRYDWKLIGKKEMYIPYNAYKLENFLIEGVDIKEVATANHTNPDFMRWELHRIWEVEATLKEGSRHIYEKRKLYIDEDSWTAVLADRFDGRGELWRTSTYPVVYYYDIQASTGRAMQFYDMQNSNYFLGYLMDTTPRFVDYKTDGRFTPAGVRKMARR